MASKLVKTLFSVLLLLITFQLSSTQKINFETRKTLPYEYESCSDPNNDLTYEELIALEKVNIKDHRYGKSNEKPDYFFGPCVPDEGLTLSSLNNHLSVWKSINSKSSEQFFDSEKHKTFNQINSPNGKHFPVKYEYRDMSVQERKNYNLKSYVSYFIFPLTSELNQIVNKLKQTKWNEAIKLLPAEYEMVTAHKVYVGSGKHDRPFDHVIATENFLAGKISKDTQPKFLNQKAIHVLLAKMKLEKKIDKLLIVPFFASNSHSASSYNEHMCLMTHMGETMNVRNGDPLNHLFKMCVEQAHPRKYLKNVLSKEAIQFVSDFNVEVGIRQIGHFGMTVQIQQANTKPKNDPQYLKSAFRWMDDNIKEWIFGNQMYCEREIRISKSKMETVFIMLPFDKIDFKFDGYGDRVNLVNTINRLMNAKFESFPALQGNANEALKPYLTTLEQKKFDSANMLSDIMTTVYEILGKEIELITNKDNKLKAQLKNKMFQAALEHDLFYRLIHQNPDMLIKARTPKPVGKVTFSVSDNFRIPQSKSPNPNYEPQPNAPYKCQYCLRTFKRKKSFTKHIDYEENKKKFHCPVCNTLYASSQELNDHRRSIHHLLFSVAQGVSSLPIAEKDVVTAPYTCPIDKKIMRNFRYKSDCIQHMETHSFYDPKRHHPMDRRAELSKIKKGKYKCLHCTKDEFYADTHLSATAHLREAHYWHLVRKDKASSQTKGGELKALVNENFECNADNAIRKMGIYKCKIPNCPSNTFTNAVDARRHFFYSYHNTFFQTNKDYPRRNELIEIYKTSKDPKLNPAESLPTEQLKFLDPLYEKTLDARQKEATKNFVIKIRNNDEFKKLDGKTYVDLRGAEEPIAIVMRKSLTFFTINKSKFKQLIIDFAKNFKNRSLLIPPAEKEKYCQTEPRFIAKHKEFKDYYNDPKNGISIEKIQK